MANAGPNTNGSQCKHTLSLSLAVVVVVVVVTPNKELARLLFCVLDVRKRF
jgi:hypothetical protein